MVPPSSAVCSCAPVGLVMPAWLSANCANASECETLPQPIGFVGGVIVIVVVVTVPSAAVDVYVSVAGDPVRNAVASATALSCEPANVSNGAANLSATRVWPADVSEVVDVDDVVDVVVVVVWSVLVVSAACATVIPASTRAIIVAPIFIVRLLMIHSFRTMLGSSRADQLFRLQNDFGRGCAVAKQAAFDRRGDRHACGVRRKRFDLDVDVAVGGMRLDHLLVAFVLRFHDLDLHAHQRGHRRAAHLGFRRRECLVDDASERVGDTGCQSNACGGEPACGAAGVQLHCPLASPLHHSSAGLDPPCHIMPLA